MVVSAGETVRFTVKYDGPAIVDGRMDARTLAPAMLATAHLFEHSAQILVGSSQTVRIEVVADFKEGSFSYDLITALKDVGEILGTNLSISDIVATGALLVTAVKVARGRKPRSVEQDPVNEGHSTITFQDGDQISVTVNVAKLFVSPTVRADLEGSVEPLKQSGIDEFELETPVGRASVARNEVAYFAAPVSEEQTLQVRTDEEIIEVVVPDFRTGNKWQVRLAGEGVVWVSIEDRSFIRKVESREVKFGRGDLFSVLMRVKVVRLAGGKLDRERTIVSVIGSVPPEQISLF